MANGGKITYDIGFNVDKSGLKDLQAQLSTLAKTTPTELMKLNPGVFKDARTDAQKALYGIKQDLKAVQTAFNDAFNPTTGLMNLQKLNIALNQIGADKLSKSFSLLGQKGQDAFYQMTKSALTTNMQLKKTNTFLDKMGTTLINTLKWTFSSSLINRFVGAVRQAVGYVEHLDSSLNDIRIVTKKSADEMEVFGQRANDAAKALGKATTDYTEAALIYYQQGLSDEEVKARAETTLKAANVTGQATKAVSEQLTSVWNGFKVNAEETEVYVDKLAAVAAMSASNLEELSTGMSKVASAASNLGVDIDQLTAQISTIVSVTRQAPESVGTALKTIYARISDLKLGESDEDGLGLGDVSGGLQKLGINVLDAEGELRDLGTVIEEVAAKWDTWTQAQQAAIAQLMAGKRQYNNLVSLFSNWDMYENAINTSRNATGELQKQQDIYMESTEAHLQQLKTEWEDFYDSLIDPKAINNLVDSISKLVKLLTNFIDGIGGGGNALLLLGSTALRVFDKQIGAGITHMIQSFQRGKENAAQLEAQLRNIELFKQTQQYKNDPAVRALLDAQDQAKKYYEILNNEQINEMNNLVAQVGEAAKIEQQWKENTLAVEDYMKKTQQVYGSANLGVDKNNKKITGDTSKYKAGSVNSSKMDAAAEERFKQTKNDIDSMTKSLKSATSQMEKFQQTSKQAKKVEIFKNIKTDVQALKDSFNNLNQTGVFKDVDQNKLQEIEKYLNQILNSTKGGAKTITAIQKLKDALQGLPEDAQKALLAIQTSFNQDFSGTLDAAQEKLRQFQEAASLQNFTTNVVNSIGAVGQFAGSINALTNAFDILQDNTVSAGEKILRLISSIGMSLPMLISSIGRIRESISGDGGIISGLTGIILKHRLAGNAAQASAAQMASAAATAKLAFIGVTLAITAVITGITLLVSHYQQIRQEAIDRNKNIIEEVNKTQELIDKNKELVNSYQDLINQYKEGTIVQAEFLEQKQKIISSMDAEGQAALNAAQNWKQAQEALDGYNKEQAKSQKEEQIKKRNAALELGFDAMSEGYGSYNASDHTFSYSKSMGSKANESLSDRDKEYIKVLQDAEFLTSRADADGNIAYQLEFTLTADEEGFNKLQQLQQIQDQFAGQISSNANNIYENIKYQFDELKKGEGYQDLEDSLKAISEADLQIAISDSQVNLQEDLEGLNKAQQSFIENLTAAGYSTDQAMTEWIKVLSDNGGKAQLELQQRLLDLRTMTQGYFKFFTGDITDTKKYGQISNIYDQLIEKGFSSEQISGLGEDYWAEIITNGLDDPSLIDKISSDIEEATEVSYEQAKDKIAETIGSTSDSIGKSISDAISGSLDTTSEDYQKLLNSLDEIKKSYPELTNEIETFSNTGLVGTEHWVQAAYDLQSALDKIEFDNLIKKSEEAKEKLTTTVIRGDTPQEEAEVEVIADDEKFQEAMQEIMDANYQIDVEVHSDAERDFNQLVTAMEKADDLASKIGEDFIVAADDIRDLNNAFPGILEGIEYLGDGTIKLNEEIVQSAMQAASQQEASSTQELTTKLQNAATELRAKAEVYDGMADIAHQAAEKQIKSEEAKTQISQKLNEIETENDKIASQTEIDNAVAVADNSNENAKISADNWTKSYQQAADSSYEFANTAIQNAAAAARGSGPISKGNFNFTYQGSNGSTSSEAKAATGFQNGEDETAYWKNQEATYRNMAESARAKANDVEGMMVGAAAKAQESLNKNTNVGKKGEDSSKSGSEKEADHMDYLGREEDIYREINTELENIESTLGRIDKVASHSWGEDYQQTLKEQNKLLDQQINKLEEKRDLQKGDLSTRRKQLEDVGVTFAEDGSVMTNAEQVLNELYAGYNAMVTKYNAMSASEQEAYKAQMETEKNRIDAIEKKIGEYESTYSEFQSTLDELLEKHYADIENEVNQFNNKINVELELSDARKEWNEFWKDVVADVSETDFGGQIAASLKQLKELIGLGTGGQGIVGKLATHLSQITSEVWAQINSANNGGQDSMFGDDTKLSKETLQEFISKTMSAIQDAEKEVDNIAENYLKTLESAKDIIDAQVDGYETISKHIDHNVNMIKLLDPEDYDALDRQYQRQYENDLNLVRTQKASKEFWQEQMKVHQQMRDSYEKGSKQWETYNKAYKEAVDNYVDATEAFDKAMEDALDKAKEIADNAAEAAYKRLDRSLSSNLSLEVMEDEWKLLNNEADRYYDNVERYLNMEEYTNYLNDAANAIGLSAENQEKLNAFRDTELKKLKEKEKLTEYDIEESKARLEIMKAEMALEDAQRNKSNMRLRRDSQGNYTYQYTADEEAIEDAENGIVTAKKAWYEIVKKRWKDVSQYIIDISKNIVEYQKKYREAKDRGDEEAAAKYLQLIEHQQKDLQLMYSEAAKNQQDLFSGTAQYFADVENAEILPQSEATVRTMVTQWTEGDDSFMGAIQNGIDEINRIQQQYVDDTQRVFEEAGESYESLRDDGIDPTKDSLDDLVESQGDLDDNLNQITEDLKDHSEALDEAVRGYEDLKDAAVDAIAEANRALETLATTAIDTKTKVNEAVTASQTAPGIGYNSVTSNSSNVNSNNNSGGAIPTTIMPKGTYTVRESQKQSGVYEMRLSNSTKPAGTPDMVSASLRTIATSLSIQGFTANDGTWAGIDKNKIPKFKTGGYTGSWGDTGKLAVLHEKELVLNSSDTKNLLSAIEILRALPFSALAKSIVDSSSNIASTFRSGVSMNGVNGAITNNDTKNMTINADFSGVQSADEIYQALIELENYGLQQSYSIAPNINNPY